MFSFICALPSPASAGSCLPLFGRFTGTTAQSDFSSTCMSVVRLCAFTDRPSLTAEGALEISRFSCMLFLSVRGFLDYAGPDSHSRLTRLPCCLPPTRQGVGILIWRFSKLNHPAHRCLGLRFATHLAMCHARLEVRMESLSPFLWGSCIPYNMPVYPGARRITPNPLKWLFGRPISRIGNGNRPSLA